MIKKLTIKHLLLLLCLFAITGEWSAVKAALPTSPTQGYLYNPESGKFFSLGDPFKSGYYSVVSDDYGLPIVLVPTTDDAVLNDGGSRFRIYVKTNDRLLRNYGEGANYTWYSGDSRSNSVFSITEKTPGKLLIRVQHDVGGTYKGTYISVDYNNPSGKLTHTGATTNPSDVDMSTFNPYAVWEFKTAAEQRAIVQAASLARLQTVAALDGLNISSVADFETAINGSNFTAIDKTSSINNPTFYSSTDGWTVTKASGSGDIGNGSYTIFNASPAQFTCTQTVSGLPSGLYKVTVQAFYRASTMARCVEYGNDGYFLSNAYLEANNSKVAIKDWYSIRTDNTNPNSRGKFRDTFNDSQYTNTVYTYVGSDGKLDLKIAVPSYGGMSGDSNEKDWFCWNDVTLTYYENNTPADDPSAAVTAAKAQATTASALLDQKQGAAELAALQSAINAVNALDAATATIEGVGAAVAALTTAQANSTTSIALYSAVNNAISTYTTKAAALDAAGQAAFDASSFSAAYTAGTLSSTALEDVKEMYLDAVKAQGAGADMTDVISNASCIENEGVPHTSGPNSTKLKPDDWILSIDWNDYCINTWSTEGNSDGSNMTTPFVQYWTPNSLLNNSTIDHTTINGLPAGDYTLSIFARTLQKKSNLAEGDTDPYNAGGCVFYANNETIALSTGTNCALSDMSKAGKYGTYTINFTLEEGDPLNIGFRLQDVDFYFLSFRDAHLTYNGAKEYESTQLTASMFHEWSNDNSATATIVNETPGCDYYINEASAAANTAYGNGVMDKPTYADLSTYEYMVLNFTGSDQPRLFFNSESGNGNAGRITVNASSQYVTDKGNGQWVIDLAGITNDAGYAHLQCIKASAWNTETTVTTVLLYKEVEPIVPQSDIDALLATIPTTDYNPSIEAAVEAAVDALEADPTQSNYDAAEAVIAQAIASAAIYAAGNDLTSFIVNPQFNDGTAGWSGNFGAGSKKGNATNYVITSFGQGYNIYQTLNGLRPGLYMLKALAFSRPLENAATWNLYKNQYKIENLTNLYANGEQQFCKLICDEKANAAADGEWHELKYDDDTTYGFIPNNSGAFSVAFYNGMYDNVLLFEVGTDGVATFGIKNESTSAATYSGFDNFRLYYVGDEIPAEAVTAVAATATQRPLNATTSAAMDAAVSTFQTSATFANYQAAKAAILAGKASADNYSDIKQAIDENEPLVAQLDAAGQAAYTNTYAAPILNGYTDGTIANEATAANNLWIAYAKAFTAQSCVETVVQDPGTQYDSNGRATKVEGEDYTTYTFNGAYHVAFKVKGENGEGNDVANCKEVVILFAEPVPSHVRVAYSGEMSMDALHEVTAGVKEYHIAIEGTQYETSGILPEITLMVDDGGEIVTKVVSVCKVMRPSVTMAVSSAAKYGTFVAPFAVTIPEGVEAYGCDECTGEVLVLDAYEGTIPANTPVILYAEAGVNQKFYGEATPEGDDVTVGYLTGVFVDTQAPVDSYVLQKHGEVVKFYVVDSETQPTVKANRCYLTLPEASVKSIGFSIADAIANINVNRVNDGSIYNLAGQKVDSSYKGIVIKNGKKFMNK